jgi:glucose/arabinose dehydrogenase
MKHIASPWLLGTVLLAGLWSCQSSEKSDDSAQTADATPTVAHEALTADINLPAPYHTESVKKYSNVIGWPEGKMPVAPAGFVVTRYATDLDSPRWAYVLPNGDVLVAEATTEKKGVAKVTAPLTGKGKSKAVGESANRITLFRDTNGDGTPDLRETFLSDLNQPFGMVLVGNTFYVANTDGLMKFPYQTGQTKITAQGQKILDLPAGGYNNHWTRNLLANADGSKIYISVGSASNVGEHGMNEEVRRAAILEINPDGSGERLYASGLRNPVGMDWAPGSNVLWTAVNERDELGDDLVPDYLTSVKAGGFYGWPYAYYNQIEDPRRKGERPDLVKKTIVPEVALGSHTASLGLAFYDGTAFPEAYRGGAFIGQHGSWNRSAFSGYKVVYIPFKGGKPAGPPQDFLTGFIADAEKGDVYGRPIGVTVLPDGSMLVTDDAADTIWRVSAR